MMVLNNRPSNFHTIYKQHQKVASVYEIRFVSVSIPMLTILCAAYTFELYFEVVCDYIKKICRKNTDEILPLQFSNQFRCCCRCRCFRFFWCVCQNIFWCCDDSVWPTIRTIVNWMSSHIFISFFRYIRQTYLWKPYISSDKWTLLRLGVVWIYVGGSIAIVVWLCMCLCVWTCMFGYLFAIHILVNRCIYKFKLKCIHARSVCVCVCMHPNTCAKSTTF